MFIKPATNKLGTPRRNPIFLMDCTLQFWQKYVPLLIQNKLSTKYLLISLQCNGVKRIGKTHSLNSTERPKPTGATRNNRLGKCYNVIYFLNPAIE